MNSIQTPTLALILARRLNSRNRYAVALAKPTPEVHVNLTGTNRAVIFVLWDEECERHYYHGHVEVKGRVHQLFTNLNHTGLEKLLARF